MKIDDSTIGLALYSLCMMVLIAFAKFEAMVLLAGVYGISLMHKE